MSSFFEVVSWLAVIALMTTSVPQIILNHKRRSSEGLSWLTFGLLLFGMSTFFIRSLFVTSDLILRLNYGIGSFVILIINLQIFYYRCLKRQNTNTRILHQ